MIKNLPANAGDVALVPASGVSSGAGNANPFQHSCPGKSHGERTLVGYSP